MTSDPLPVFLTFDVEDVVTPYSDDIIVTIADLLGERGVPAVFFITGDKARALVRRGRSDVFHALRRHDVGYHSNHHSTHPTISEYLEGLSWDEGVAEVVQRESSGAEFLRFVLDRNICGFATPGTSWGAQVAGALAVLGIPAHVHSFSRTASRANPHWYAGALCFSRVESVGPVEESLLDPTRFGRLLDDLPVTVTNARERNAAVLQLNIGHPTMFVNREFWDAANYADGRNPPAGQRLTAPPERPVEETRTMIANLVEFVDRVRAMSSKVEIVRFSEFVEGRIGRSREYRPATLAEAISQAVASADIPTDLAWASPADLTYLMCRAVCGAAPPRQMPVVLGPTGPGVGPEQEGAGPVTLARDELVGCSANVYRHVDRHGALPARSPAPGCSVPIQTMYRTLVELAADGPEHLRSRGTTIRLTNGVDVPAVGQEIADHLQSRAKRWLHRSSLDTTGLARLAKWQAWSLRPA